MAGLVSALMIASAVCERTARILPSYERKDITAIAERESWTESDYDVLYHQTGLGRPALDALKQRAGFSAQTLIAYQDAFFFNGELEHDMAAVTTPHDRYANGYSAPVAPLESGDIVVSSACHTFGWRNGHAALIVNGASGTTIESFSPSTNSGYGTLRWFLQSSNFLILRLKEEYKEQFSIDPQKVAEDAIAKLRNVPYDLTVGIFSPKDQCANGKKAQKTHCAHLVWQAYQNFGIDIDSNGGAIVTARDIARSKFFEVVQVNGFDPDQLW
ncbi:MAG: hypothetical protein K2H43_02495 [Clostridia bacterium]|nr:hypothetical protein [Clostridia bacterium]